MTAEEYKETLTAAWPAMTRVALGLLRDTDSARDAVQETAISLWTHLDKLEKAANRQAYCTGALRLTCMARLRSRAPRDDLAAAEETPAPETETETEDYLMTLVGRLPRQQQEVFLLRVRSEMEFAAIADRLSITQDYARQLLSRARKTLRNLYHRNDL